jgi:hypothetical protein
VQGSLGMKWRVGTDKILLVMSEKGRAREWSGLAGLNWGPPFA